MYNFNAGDLVTTHEHNGVAQVIGVSSVTPPFRHGNFSELHLKAV